MNKNWFLFIVIIGFIIFQFSKTQNEELKKSNDKVELTTVSKLLEIANSHKGVSYKAGGTTKNGMDCSGLVHTSFKKIGVVLPRSSKEISFKGTKITLDEVKIGDLLFFDIARLKGGINHVGLVTSVINEEILFIHSTTSKGVIISSMNENYWKKEFVKAKRIQLN
ncbi:C40 family peptidase [Tenacibaculum insulae]|uniref:C40 family peptidase n=1 Tax=Tenacibaculum insulae TaxID=2029677 RepID=UPI003AB8DBE1